MSIDLQSPIILDIGSYDTKAGFSTQQLPQLTFHNYIGSTPQHSKLIGNSCDNHIPNIKLNYPLQNGLFTNKEDIPIIFNHIFSSLNLSESQIQSHPLLITEPLLTSQTYRDSLSSILFETFHIPALSIARAPFLSMFSTSKTTSLILESGDSLTQVCCVYNGFSIPTSFKISKHAGKDVNAYLQVLLYRNGYSFGKGSELEIVRQIKETLCIASMKKSESTEAEFHLPDGSGIKIKEEKEKAVDVLFDRKSSGKEGATLQEMIVGSVEGVDVDMRRKMYGSVLLSGGNTLFKGIQERVCKEVKAIVDGHMKVGVLCGKNRKNGCWIGGNIVVNMSGFEGMWVKKGEYEEKGGEVLKERMI